MPLLMNAESFSVRHSLFHLKFILITMFRDSTQAR